MQKIDSLTLPNILPHEKSIKSCRQSIHNYEPEFWESFYETERYLKNISEEKLIERYRNLCRNFSVLTSSERHNIPVNSFLSSWYWYLKEHQTRYEFHLRGLVPSNQPPQPRRPTFNKPFSPKSPNACDILFRYGDLKYMKQFIDEGKIRISPASKYKVGDTSDPRTDDELNKNIWKLGDNIKIRDQGGKETSIIGDLKITTSTPNNYYTLCLSCDFEPLIFKEFNYDACVVIKNPEEFARRLGNETKKQLPDWFFYHNPIEYFDPHELKKNQYVNVTMSKDFLYAYQMEYRYLWDPLSNVSTQKHIEVNLGSLNDICELYILDDTA